MTNVFFLAFRKVNNFVGWPAAVLILMPPTFHRRAIFLLLEKKGQVQPAVTRHERRSFAVHILNPLDMRIHQVPPNICHTYWFSKSRLSDPFFWAIFGHVWAWEPMLHSEISYFQNLSVFSNFLRDITLYAIDMYWIWCIGVPPLLFVVSDIVIIIAIHMTINANCYLDTSLICITRGL